MRTLLCIFATWLALQLLFLAWTRVRCALWEKRQRRTNSGTLADAEPFDCGNARAGTAILFVHGFVDVPKFFERAAREISGTNACFCRAMRLPGWGKSPRFGARRERVDTARWRDALLNEILDLQAAFPRVCVVAHSLGGAITLAACRKIERAGTRPLDALVLLTPLFKVSPARSPIFPAHVWHKIVRYAFPLIRGIESPLSAVRIDEATEFAYCADKFVHRDILDAMFQLMRENARETLATPPPTLLVLAKQERVVDNAATLAGTLATWENKKILHVDCEHPILMREAWRTVVSEITAFLF